MQQRHTAKSYRTAYRIFKPRNLDFLDFLENISYFLAISRMHKDSTMDETKTIAEYVADLDYSPIPARIQEEMKVLLFDYLGVALGGTRTESGRIAAQFSKDLGEKGEATIIGFGSRVSAPSAAFSNAILSHSIELDDVDSLAYFHFSPPILSAALAMGEREHSSGRDLLVAMVAGCDLMARLSSAMNPSLRDRGFHTTPICGVFGAAAASAKLLRLDPQGIINTLGLAGAQASGLMEFYGTSMQKRFNPGPSARAGVISALMAQRGFSGAGTILEGERGFLKAYSDRFDPEKLLEGLGTQFPIFVEYLRHTKFPAEDAVDLRCGVVCCGVVCRILGRRNLFPLGFLFCFCFCILYLLSVICHNFISTSTPAGSSSFISSSTVLGVGSIISTSLLCILISNCSRDFLST